MRSYEEYCAIAKSLDLVGDRWTLLVVRELSLRGPARYTDLPPGLPIGTVVEQVPLDRSTRCQFTVPPS